MVYSAGVHCVSWVRDTTEHSEYGEKGFSLYAISYEPPAQGHGSSISVLLPVTSLLLLALLVASAFGVLAPAGARTAARAAASFTFTAVGDYSQTRYTSANLSHMKTSGAAFHLALGDFSYACTITGSVADAWSTYVSGNVGAGFPFEIIPGRHDDSGLSNYAADLPDRLGSGGTYANQCYFDYPATSPLARFNMIAPGQIPGYYYTKGSNWPSTAPPVRA
jgi:hypothetical protein